MSVTFSMCGRRGKFFGGCKFEPRYNRETPSLTPEQIDAVHEAFGDPLLTSEMESVQGESTTYIGDVCIRCGRWADKA